ncbi:hypothetical protein SAMN04488696_0903 [Methanolobus profundi]|uniref:DUF5714 domain-containing protein n=2 Tax=Methanolobus profundi TaxID=487685 RepID=A0A1I4PUC6_9EURY|nr:hypothetical protein SAMN04488696_0903 [Methanolobus profundi]
MEIGCMENTKNDVCGKNSDNIPVIQVLSTGTRNTCKTDCLVCGTEVDYMSEPVNATCHYCGVEERTYFVCNDGHYVCNRCHSEDAMAVIENICRTTDIADPLTIAEMIMEHPSIHMHGPEHHALIPAVLVTAYQNYTGNTDKGPIVEAMRRGSLVPGGYCGLYGACAAGIGVGIAMCVLLEATPLTPEERAHANWATACTLKCIADAGGARCCKKSTRISLEEGMKYLSDMFDLGWYEKADFHVNCDYTQYNRECDTDCRYRSEG